MGDRLDRKMLGTKIVLLAQASILALAATPAFAQSTGDSVATPATAPQTSGSSNQAATVDGDDTDGSADIIVTGIRASLANSQEIKRNANTIVDAVTASDIGALPDRSVTEALQRLPGVTMNRFANASDPDHFSVEGNNVTIRGLTFVRSEFNGRDTFSAGIYGQAIDFSAVPAELLGSVEVYKNTTAAMIEGGLAGTVNLNTRVPLDNKGFHLSFDEEANYGDMSKDLTPTLSGMISNTWDTGIGTFGLLADVSYSKIRSRADGIQITNFQTRDGTIAGFTATGQPLCRNPLPTDEDTVTLPPAGTCGVAGAPGADGFADYASGARYAPLGGQFRTQEFDHERIGGAFAAQWQSNDGRAKLTAQYLRTQSTQRMEEHTFESLPDIAEFKTYPAGCVQNGNNGTNTGAASGQPRAECPVGQFQNYQYDANGVFEKGFITMPGSGWASVGSGTATERTPTGGMQQSLAYDQELQKSVNQDFGLNFKFKPDNHWSFNFDADYTTAVTDDIAVDVYGGTFADEELDLTGKIPTVIPHKPLTLAPAWGTASPILIGETDSEYFNDPAEQYWRGAMDHVEHSTGHEWALKTDIAYDLDNDDLFLKKISVGARVNKRQETIRNTAYNWGVLSEIWTGASEAISPAQTGNYTRYNFPDFFRGQTQGPPGAFYYAGNLLDNYKQFSQFAAGVENLWFSQGVNPDNVAEWVPVAARPGVIPGTSYLPSEIQDVSETNKAAYVMLDFGSDTLFKGLRLEGNIGVRYVGMRTTSLGNVGAPTLIQTGTSGPYHGPIDPVTGLGTGTCDLVPPNPGAPPGTPDQPRGGPICQLTEQQYNDLQTFSNGVTTPDLAVQNLNYFLPSLNVKLGLSRDFIIRFAASRVLTPPSLVDIRNFLQTGFDATLGQLTTQAGNPYLKPATADQFDLTAEWYFARVGSLSFDLFYKRLHHFFYSDVSQRVVTNNGISETLTVQGPANYNGTGTIKGLEASYQQTFDFLPGFLKGFGTNLTYTYLESKGVPNSLLLDGLPAMQSTVPQGNLPLEQLSKHNVNATLFYEKGPISLRAAYSWRSRFLLTARDYIYPRFPIWNAATGQLDASAFLTLSKNIKIGVQGVNLTNSITKTEQQFTADGMIAPRSYFMNDRRFSFIIRGNF